MPIQPGEIYFADMGGDDRHRIIIVSREALNRGKYVVAVPCTSTRFDERRTLPECVPFLAGQFGMTKDCVARADQITYIEVEDIDLESGVIANLSDEKMREVILAIGHVLDANCEPN